MYFLHKPLSYQFQRIHYKNHSDTPTNTPQEIRVFYALIHLECWQRNDLLLLKGSLALDPGALAEHACPSAGSIPANLRSRWNLDAWGGVPKEPRPGAGEVALPSGRCRHRHLGSVGSCWRRGEGRGVPKEQVPSPPPPSRSCSRVPWWRSAVGGAGRAQVGLQGPGPASQRAERWRCSRDTDLYPQRPVR